MLRTHGIETIYFNSQQISRLRMKSRWLDTHKLILSKTLQMLTKSTGMKSSLACQALENTGADHFFSHCLITSKCHPIPDTIEQILDKTRSLKQGCQLGHCVDKYVVIHCFSISSSQPIESLLTSIRQQQVARPSLSLSLYFDLWCKLWSQYQQIGTHQRVPSRDD